MNIWNSFRGKSEQLISFLRLLQLAPDYYFPNWSSETRAGASDTNSNNMNISFRKVLNIFMYDKSITRHTSVFELNNLRGNEAQKLFLYISELFFVSVIFVRSANTELRPDLKTGPRLQPQVIKLAIIAAIMEI